MDEENYYRVLTKIKQAFETCLAALDSQTKADLYCRDDGTGLLVEDWLKMFWFFKGLADSASQPQSECADPESFLKAYDQSMEYFNACLYAGHRYLFHHQYDQSKRCCNDVVIRLEKIETTLAELQERETALQHAVSLIQTLVCPDIREKLIRQSNLANVCPQ